MDISLSLFSLLFFITTSMDQVVEMMVWVLTPAFFIAGAIFLIYVYKCEDEKED